jgi:hypothetical protein
MDTQSSNVGTGFAADPENGEMPVVVELVQLALVDSSDTELSFDGGDERRSLEESSGEGLKSSRELRLSTGHGVVETNNTDVFLSGTLL